MTQTIQQIRSTEENVLFLDNGNLFPDNPNKKVELAEASLQIFNLMGCSAMGIGRNESSLGLDSLHNMLKQNPLPFVSTNVISKDTGKPIIGREFLMLNAGDMKIAVISLLPPNLKQETDTTAIIADATDTLPAPVNIVANPSIDIITPDTAVEKVLPKLKEADMVLLLSQLPFTETKEIMTKFAGDIDFAICPPPKREEKHIDLQHPKISTTAVHGMSLGLIKVKFDKTGNISVLENRSLPIDGQFGEHLLVGHIIKEAYLDMGGRILDERRKRIRARNRMLAEEESRQYQGMSPLEYIENSNTLNNLEGQGDLTPAETIQLLREQSTNKEQVQ